MDVDAIDWQKLAQGNSRRKDEDDAALMVMFQTKAVPDKEATELEGCARHKNVPFVEIRVPGSRDVILREATERDKTRFARQWALYEAGRQGEVDGTPIELFPLLNPAQVADLRSSGVRSIEQLAAVSDGQLDGLGMGARSLRERARQFFQGASETEQDLRAQLAAERRENANLKAQLRQALDGDAEELEPVDRMAKARAARAAKRANAA